MATTTVTVRCPRCGQDLSVAVAPAPPTQWFPCPNCHVPVPVVVPRDLPPLYSWEVIPGLYPVLPRPRRPRWRARTAAGFALVGVVVLAAAFGGLLAYLGFVAAEPGSYQVSGTVFEMQGSQVVPAAGALVVLTNDEGAQQSATTGVDGTFEFAGVPSGGVTLNVSASGYAPVVVQTFVSSVYDAGSQGLTVTLVPGGASAVTTNDLTLFPDLETLLATIGGAVVLFGIVAGVAAIAAVAVLRRGSAALGVVGGAAGLFAPATIYLLGLGSIFPVVSAATASLAACGAFALTVEAIELYRGGIPESG